MKSENATTQWGEGQGRERAEHRGAEAGRIGDRMKHVVDGFIRCIPRRAQRNGR